MANQAAQPTIKGEGYAEQAVPQKTPDRSVETPERVYTVVGPKSVFGLEPNETGTLALSEGVAQALIEAGHLVLAEGEDGRSADDEEVTSNG